jgi:hypothetical protein
LKKAENDKINNLKDAQLKKAENDKINILKDAQLKKTENDKIKKDAFKIDIPLQHLKKIDIPSERNNIGNGLIITKS